MDDLGAKRLCAGIIAQAVKDYSVRIKQGKDVSSIEAFFLSDDFKLISDLDGTWLLREVKRIPWEKKRTLKTELKGF